MTVPGALSIVSSHMVWIESITTSAASLACSRLATMSRTLIEAASSIGAVGDAQAAGAQADLVDGFLAGDVQHAPAGPRQAGGGLQQQGRFADAGIAADQHGRGRDQAAAQHAVQFGDADRRARRRFGVAGQADEGDGAAGRCFGGGAGPGGDCFFDDGVPLAAGLATAGPFGGDGAAGLADEAGGGFGQGGSGAGRPDSAAAFEEARGSRKRPAALQARS